MEEVQRIVRGGATMFPQENPRPKPLEFKVVLLNFLHAALRGSFFASLATSLVYPYYLKWIKIHLNKGGTEMSAFVKLITFIHVSIYFGMYSFLEVGGRFDFLHQYQLPRTPAQEPTLKMKLHAAFEFITSAILSYYFFLPRGFLLMKKRGMPDGTSILPSFSTMYFHFVLAYCFNRINFAIAHRILHYGPIYRAIHKKHHEFVG